MFQACHGQSARVLPAYKAAQNRLCRLSEFLTVDTCHRPPRAVGMPRAFRAFAIPPKLVMPVAWMARITGSTSAAKRSASEIYIARPSVAASAALVGLLSLAPRATDRPARRTNLRLPTLQIAVFRPALEIGASALADTAWAHLPRPRLHRDAVRLGWIGGRAGWQVVGDAALSVTFDTSDAAAAQERLGRHRIWSRDFRCSNRCLRLGLPAAAARARLEAALES